VKEQELWRRHDSSIVTFIEDGKLVLRLPNKFDDRTEDENSETSEDSEGSNNIGSSEGYQTRESKIECTDGCPYTTAIDFSLTSPLPALLNDTAGQNKKCSLQVMFEVRYYS
jgi:hypothetical protein